MTDEQRQFNGRMIEEMCAIGEAVMEAYVADLRKQVVSAGDYNYAESLYLHGDLSGK